MLDPYKKTIKSKHGPPFYFLIIGCGYFGRKAVEKLLQKDPRSRIIVVDRSKKALHRVSSLPVQTVVCDGTLSLTQFLSEEHKPDYIIPAIPIHLAFAFILSQLKPLGWKKERVPIPRGLPNPVMGKTGDLYTSLSDFLCPENCSEPAQYCTLTKKRRPKPLFQILKELKGPFQSKVIRSHQLAPGVGGIKTKDLLDILIEAKKRRKPAKRILISTASRCHGVSSMITIN